MSRQTVRSTEDIIWALTKGRDERLAAGEQVDVAAVQQEIIAHQQLARLREDRAARATAKDWLRVKDIDAQIRHWLRFVAEDVDEQAAAPGRNATKLVAPAPPADA